MFSGFWRGTGGMVWLRRLSETFVEVVRTALRWIQVCLPMGLARSVADRIGNYILNVRNRNKVGITRLLNDADFDIDSEVQRQNLNRALDHTRAATHSQFPIKESSPDTCANHPTQHALPISAPNKKILQQKIDSATLQKNRGAASVQRRKFPTLILRKSNSSAESDD